MPGPIGSVHGKLTPRHEQFAREFIVDLNMQEAARRAGYKGTPGSLAKMGWRIMQNPAVGARIAELQKAIVERVELNAETVLRELLHIAKCDIGKAFDDNGNLIPLRDMPESVRRSIAAIEVEETREINADGAEGGTVTRVKKVKFWDKTVALKMLGEHLRLFMKQVEVTDLTDRATALRKARERVLRLAPPTTPPEAASQS